MLNFLKGLRPRHWFMGFGSAVILTLLLLTDPDAGLLLGIPMPSTVAALVGLVTPLLAVTFAHLARRGLFDYLDLKLLADKACESPVGAGLVFLGVCQVINALLNLFGS